MDDEEIKLSWCDVTCSQVGICLSTSAGIARCKAKWLAQLRERAEAEGYKPAAQDVWGLLTLIDEFGYWLTHTESESWDHWQKHHSQHGEGMHDAYAAALFQWQQLGASTAATPTL